MKRLLILNEFVRRLRKETIETTLPKIQRELFSAIYGSTLESLQETDSGIRSLYL